MAHNQHSRTSDCFQKAVEGNIHPKVEIQQQSVDSGHQINRDKEQKQRKSKVGQNDLLLNAKSKTDIVSGYSFSRFEAISQSSQKSKTSEISCESGQANQQVASKPNINRAPTSTKVISSKKIIEDPIEVKSVQFDEFPIPNQAEQKHEYTFQYNFISAGQILNKFTTLAASRAMDSKLTQNEARVIKRAPFIKSILSLCFPNSQFQDEIYQLTCLGEKRCRITHQSGSDQKYYTFREDFLLLLWQEKLLVCGSLHENLRHFIRQFNIPLKGNSNDSQSLYHDGRIDILKIEIEKSIVALSKDVGEQFDKLLTKCNEQNLTQMNKAKSKIKQFQSQLKIQLQSQLQKEQQLKKSRSQSIDGEETNQDKIFNQKVEKEKELVTPSVERMLMGIFYLHLDLEGIVKKYIAKEKDIGEFEKKKMIIKGSLRPINILNYIELFQFSKILEAIPTQSNILERSTKILSCLKFSSYPSPDQILQVTGVFRNTVLKEAQCYLRTINESKVKLHDQTNIDRQLLQLSIFCIIMCENRDIYPTIQTAILFSPLQDPKLKGSCEQSVETAKILRKAIKFVQNEWEL